MQQWNFREARSLPPGHRVDTRNSLENIYFNICALLNWVVDPGRIATLETTELIDAIVAGLRVLKTRAISLPSITCPACGKTSYNPQDILNKYCGNCHAWHSNLIGGSQCPAGE